MTERHILMVCAKYAEQLRDMGCPPMREVVNFHGAKDFKILALRHCAYMLERITEQLEAGQYDKANRWLGFVQGVFYAVGYAGVDDMKDMNRDPDNPLLAKFKDMNPAQITEFINQTLCLHGGVFRGEKCGKCGMDVR